MGCVWVLVSLGLFGWEVRGQLNNPVNRGDSRRSEWVSKWVLIWAWRSFTVPSSERPRTPAISCKSPLFFKVKEPLNGSLGSWSALCCHHTAALSPHCHAILFFFCFLMRCSSSCFSASCKPSSEVSI